MQNVVSTFVGVQDKLGKAPYDPAVGVRLVKLDDASIEGILVSLVHVQIDPGKEVAAHLHENNGEVCQALTDVVAYLGETIKNSSGEYEMEDGKVKVNWQPSVSMHAGDTIKIPEGIAHFFLNTNMESTANVQFIIPNSHFLADVQGVVDKKLTMRPNA